LPALPLAAQQYPNDDKELAPYFPSPRSVVFRMLDTAGVKEGDHVYDLGSGDGRIVVLAAQRFKAKSTGVELNPSLVERSRRAIQRLKLDGMCTIVEGDFTQQDYSPATVVTLYLLPEANKALQPVLERTLKKGTRVVAHDFPVPTWKETRQETILDDGEGRSHTLYLYIR
jgi:cyclopropane fatty-acyl-phospholipid synthase-like methyltransferase